eukprot:TRINITY_DN456_c0_g1_i1.p1 TRINITY_DN456_c0_g1~~TRINITY_DN456_c0_g1_i1.p1  ORF type:complete len:530 (+),score=93.87 TRINITY_DN456_c0_g1_i1:85-1674(+)
MSTYTSLDDQTTEKSIRSSSNKRTFVLVGVLFITIIVVIIILVAVFGGISGPVNLSAKLNANDIMKHLRELQDAAADQPNGSRAVALGYNSSVAYILSQLNSTKLNVSVQHFPVSIWSAGATPIFKQNYPLVIDYKNQVDFQQFTYTVNAVSVNQTLVSVGLGCTDSDYPPSWVPGNIALIQRGDCNFVDKTGLAQSKGASGAVVYNTSPSLFSARAHDGCAIPVIAVSSTLGYGLLETLPLLTIETYGSINTYITSNIIADTIDGRSDRVVVWGSHLDSVPAGPGINDNGSGSATNLQVALLVDKLKYKPKNKLRFCWWGAEEIGLLGSQFYVQNLLDNDREEYKRIALNLNFDMIGSPNFFRGIYQASSGAADFPSIVNGSSMIQDVFEEEFNSRQISYNFTSFDGRSDYGPFIAAGIPALGLFTGAEGIKSIDYRTQFGGLANAAYDPCYHLICDTVDNIHVDALSQMSQIAAAVFQKLGDNEELVDKIAKSNNRTDTYVYKKRAHLMELEGKYVGTYDYHELELM